jgi:hypothetical protein
VIPFANSREDDNEPSSTLAPSDAANTIDAALASSSPTQSWDPSDSSTTAQHTTTTSHTSLRIAPYPTPANQSLPISSNATGIATATASRSGAPTLTRTTQISVYTNDAGYGGAYATDTPTTGNPANRVGSGARRSHLGEDEWMVKVASSVGMLLGLGWGGLWW